MLAKRKKRGRPTLPEGSSRSVVLHLKVTPAEAMLIDSVAARHGVNRSEIIRRAVHILSIYPTLMPPEPTPFRYDPSKQVVSKEDFEFLYPEGKRK